MGVTPLRGTLRAACHKDRRKYHYTQPTLYRDLPQPHGSLGSLLIARPLRDILAAEATSLHLGGKIRNTELFCCQGSNEVQGYFFVLLHITTDIFYPFWGTP